MKNSVITKIFISFFILILVMPLFFFRWKDTVSQYENRNLTALNLSSENSIKDNITNFENYFSDHIGFKDHLLEANTWIQWKVFHHLTHPRLFIGKEGEWFWAGDPYMFDDYQKINLMTDEELAAYTDSVSRLGKYLEERDISFTYMINPDKQQVYPDCVPDSIRVVGEESKTEQILNDITANTDVDVFWTRDTLQEARKTAQVYWKRRDASHWNYEGAYAAYLELMRHLTQSEDETAFFSEPDFELRTMESNVYGVVDNSETYYGYNIDMTGITIDTVYSGNANLTSPNTYYNYYNRNCENDEVLLIFGDSYIYSYMLPLLSQNYRQVVFVHFQDIGNLKVLLDEYQPDHVLLENVERSFTTKIGTNINAALQE